MFKAAKSPASSPKLGDKSAPVKPTVFTFASPDLGDESRETQVLSSQEAGEGRKIAQSRSREQVQSTAAVVKRCGQLIDAILHDFGEPEEQGMIKTLLIYDQENSLVQTRESLSKIVKGDCFQMVSTCKDKVTGCTFTHKKVVRAGLRSNIKKSLVRLADVQEKRL